MAGVLFVGYGFGMALGMSVMNSVFLGVMLSISSTVVIQKCLEEMGLIRTEKRGVQKVIYSDQTPEEVFSEARESMCNPVKRTIYVPKTNIKTDLVLSGYSALSEYSMINPPMVVCFAAGSVATWEKEASNKLQSSDDQCAVELWRYDPRKLSSGNCVDKLSLALALSADKDERIEEAVEEMLKSAWEELNGKRN